jgi:hypothetical protein
MRKQDGEKIFFFSKQGGSKEHSTPKYIRKKGESTKANGGGQTKLH